MEAKRSTNQTRETIVEEKEKDPHGLVAPGEELKGQSAIIRYSAREQYCLAGKSALKGVSNWVRWVSEKCLSLGWS